MKVLRSISASLIYVSVLAFGIRGQQVTSSKWEGEWGEYRSIGTERFPRYAGGELRISGCKNQTCEVAVEVAGSDGHCGGSGELQITGESSAVVQLKSGLPSGLQQCLLTLKLNTGGDKPYIELKPAGDCSFFCTENFAFRSNLPLKSKSQFYGAQVQQCFIGTSRARLAICSDKPLANLEKEWIYLSYGVADLEGKQFQPSPAEEKILNECDLAADSNECLTSSFQKQISNLQERKKTWEAQVTQPGDRAEASRQIDRIAGTYERSFENGDVSGDTYSVTDKLSIVRASENSIRFDAHLNFFNGHECNASGTAEYKTNGTFVFQREQSPEGVCVLEIVPTSEGVKFADPTGKCRLYDCGMRGGWGGAKFAFSERKQVSDSSPNSRK